MSNLISARPCVWSPSDWYLNLKSNEKALNFLRKIKMVLSKPALAKMPNMKTVTVISDVHSVAPKKFYKENDGDYYAIDKTSITSYLLAVRKISDLHPCEKFTVTIF